MGFGTTFCRKMAKRSFQYAVRSTYPMFEPNKLKRTKAESRRKKEEEPVRDKVGKVFCGQRWCKYKGSEEFIVSHTKKTVTFKDGSKHRVSSVELLP